MITKTILFKSFLLTSISLALIPGLCAQQRIIKNYSAGFRIFEYSLGGNDITNLAPQLKEPIGYLNYLKTIPYNSLHGHTSIAYLNNFYINLELQGRDSASQFWKKHSIPVGIVFTNRLSRSAGTIENNQSYIVPDTIIRISSYSVTEQIQFIGLNTGINRRFKLSRNLNFLTGFQVQAGVAAVHKYEQHSDSSIYQPSVGWRRFSTSNLPDLAGKNYFMWQAMIPLGLEVNLYKQQFFIRMEAILGIVVASTPQKNNINGEAHAIGIWLVYQPNRK